MYFSLCSAPSVARVPKEANHLILSALRCAPPGSLHRHCHLRNGTLCGICKPSVLHPYCECFQCPPFSDLSHTFARHITTEGRSLPTRCPCQLRTPMRQATGRGRRRPSPLPSVPP
ncbi:hypothetical protein E2C01_068192 [Portunus trituberculatus]|uniref:Uncharacterized protein n=1 Tax=Portunus trituberculatus TaxID=210409 RepID=A0A5B7HRA1_PORTR|nr:hypothetical protein [Portunus trituberculatus]